MFCWAAIADPDAAEKAVLRTVSGEAEIEKRVERSSDVVKFLGIPDGEVRRGHVFGSH
jgi:hypothetical protein